MNAVVACDEGIEKDSANLQSQKVSTSSYSGILKSSSIIGGSKVLEYAIALLRTKIVAILLGPSGVGIASLFTSATSLVGSVSSLGIAAAGVRGIASAHGSADAMSVTRFVVILRRACWITGLLGWACTAIFSRQLSQWAFGSTEQAFSIALLGITLLFAAIAGGQASLLQGTRRIGDLAKMTISGSVLSSLVVIPLYVIWKQKGIVPGLILASSASLIVSWWFARRVPLKSDVVVTWSDTWFETRSLCVLGIAMVWGGLLASITDLTIRGWIVRELGVSGGGMYHAAWALSGMFAGFVLTAMGTDFYPRLSALQHKHLEMNQAINEQIEIGVLLAFPGIVATLFSGPFIILLAYSTEFAPSAELLSWLVLGTFCRVVSWPLGFAILAKSASKCFFFTQSLFCFVQLLLTYFLIQTYQLNGVGVAFFATFIPVGLANLVIVGRLTGFSWSRGVRRLVLICSASVAVVFALQRCIPAAWGILLGVPFSFCAVVFSSRELLNRLGSSHRIVELMRSIPGSKWLLGIEQN